MRLRRAGGGGIILVGRIRYMKIKFMRPGVRAFQGRRQVQVGRLMIRVGYRLRNTTP